MSRKIGKAFVLILAGILVFGALAGCAPTQTSPSTTGSSKADVTTAGTTGETTAGTTAGTTEGTTETESSSTTSDEIPLSEMDPITFEMFKPWSGEEIPADDSVISSMVYDKTKVRVNFTLPPAEADEKLNIMLVSQEFPDIIEFPDVISMQKFIDAGVLIPLDSLVREQAPNLLANLGPIYDQLKQEDGNIYHIPMWFRALGKEEFPESWDCIFSRTGVLEDMGWFSPKTLDDFTTVLKKVRDEYDMIPIMVPLADPGYSPAGVIKGASGLAGTSDIYLDENNKVAWLYKSPQARQFISWMNMLYREGLLNEESITMRSEMIETKLNAGELYSAIGVASSLSQIFEEKGIKEALWNTYLKLDDSVEKMTYCSYSVYYPTGYGVTTSCSDPERFFKFVNFMNSEEGYLTSHGPVNMDGDTNADGFNHYLIDGAIIPTESLRKAMEEDEDYWLKQGLWFWNQFHSDTSNPATTTIDFLKMEEDVGNWWNDTEREVFPKLGMKGTDYWPNQRSMGVDVSEITELPLDPDSDENIIKIDVDDYFRKQLPKMVIAATEADFNELFDEFIQTSTDLGIDQYIAKMEELHQERLALWNQ